MGRHKVLGNPGAFIIGIKAFIGALFTYLVNTVLAMASPEGCLSYTQPSMREPMSTESLVL